MACGQLLVYLFIRSLPDVVLYKQYRPVLKQVIFFIQTAMHSSLFTGEEAPGRRGRAAGLSCCRQPSWPCGACS